jgi:hypothetical protein
LFPCWKRINLGKYTCYLSAFTIWKIIHFMKNTLFRWNGEIHVSCGRTQSVFEAGVSNTLFLYENWVRFWKEYCLALSISSGCIIHFVQNSRVHLNWRNTSISWKKTSMLEAGVSSTLFPFEIWVSLWNV